MSHLGLGRKAIVIGIAGPSASGKSLLSNTIVNEFKPEEVVVISEDSYYKTQDHLPKIQREKTNYDHPDAFDHELLLEQLDILRFGGEVEIPVYDHAEHTRSNVTRCVMHSHIIVLEGILIFAEKKLRDMMDIKIYMDTQLDLCLLRRITRDVVERSRSLESVINQYQQTVRPMFLQFVEPSKKYADIIIPIGGKNKVAINLIKAQMKEILTNDRCELVENAL